VFSTNHAAKRGYLSLGTNHRHLHVTSILNHEEISRLGVDSQVADADQRLTVTRTVPDHRMALPD